MPRAYQACAVGLWLLLRAAAGDESGITFADLTGRGFAPAKVDIWRKDSAAGLVEHVLGVSPPGDIDSAIRLFDGYSQSHQLGMHLGAEKGDVIEATVNEALARRTNSSAPLTVLEVGSHFGDGTLRIARALRNAARAASDPPHVVVSLEGNNAWASGCLALVAHSLNTRDYRDTPLIHYSLAVRPGRVDAAAKAVQVAFGVDGFDVVLLDHEHQQYLPDLQRMVQMGILVPGALVHADNAGRNAAVLKDYLRYVEGGGPFVTRFHNVDKPYLDKVAVSEYKPALAEEL